MNNQQAGIVQRAQANNWTWKSPYSVKVTVDRLLEIVQRHPDVLHYDRIDQQAVAKISHHDIRPVETVYFQNSQLVGKLLSADITMIEHLPIKTMVWEDENGKVWLKTPNIHKLDENYDFDGADGAIQAIYDLLPGWVEEAVQV